MENDEDEVVKEFMEEFDKMMKQTKTYGCTDEGCLDACLGEDLCVDSEEWKTWTSLKKYSKRQRGGDRKLKTIRKQLNNVYSEDIEMLYDLMIHKEERKAALPNLDGLFGGKPCKLANGSKCTSNQQNFAEHNFLLEAQMPGFGLLF